MKITTYEEFVQLVEKYKILPFAQLAPEHPALTVVTADDAWHTELDSDPWFWRIRIAQEGAAAYGKFFGGKAAFIERTLFPAVRVVLTGNQTVEERYEAGGLSRAAHRVYGVISTSGKDSTSDSVSASGNIDSRHLRKAAGLAAKEDKKEYDKALNELMGGGYIVITGSARQKESWSSMCYQTSEDWVREVQGNGGSGSEWTVEEAKLHVADTLKAVCSEKAYIYFAKKLGLT